MPETVRIEVALTLTLEESRLLHQIAARHELSASDIATEWVRKYLQQRLKYLESALARPGNT